MTEPSDAAKRKACELANQIDDTGLTVADWMREYAQGPFLALALYIDKVDKVAREINARIVTPMPEGPFVDLLRSLMLPDEPDPLIEAFEASTGTDDPNEWAKRFRAELKKRGLTIAEEK